MTTPLSPIVSGSPQSAPLTTLALTQTASPPIVFQGRKWTISFHSLYQTISSLFSEAIFLITQLFRSLENFMAQSNPEAVLAYGSGMSDMFNSCYITSIVQAVRFLSIFPEIEPQTAAIAPQNRIARSLQHLYEIIEGRNGHVQRPITTQELEAFRQELVDAGFSNADTYDQGDASQFCLFLLNQLGVQPFTFTIKNSYSIDPNVTLIEPPCGRQTDNHISLAIGNQIRVGATLEDLVLSNPVAEEMQIEKNGTRTHGMIDTKQSIELSEDRLPKILPINLKRYTFNPTTQQAEKNNTAIIPSQFLHLPIAQNPHRMARYILRSFVIHMDNNSPESGHYYTYAVKAIDNRILLVEYDGVLVKFQSDPEKEQKNYFGNASIADDIVQNGCLFFYEFMDTISC